MTASRRWLPFFLGAIALTLSTATLTAQCPDGTPPPCSVVRQAGGAGARRAYPQLNPRGWIVVPFANEMHAQDLDWLSDASVDLLSLDMSRWTDVDVVPDKRVADLVRELPPSRGTGALTLSEGIALAKRAGAAMLVMGDFFRLGSGARLVAKVFDVRTGRTVRTVAQAAPNADSLLTAFTPLARGVLAVPPPVDARMGELGTHSLDAYQAYLEGVRALRRFELHDARLAFTRALQLDSTFALAHMKLAEVLGYSGGTESAQERAHALAAQRLGSGLPPRDRSLIAGEVAMAARDYPRACATFAPLVARDSNDVEALFQMGACAAANLALVRPSASEHFGHLAVGLNTGLRLLTRVLDLDPQFYPAFGEILAVLSTPNVVTCEEGTPPQETCTGWGGAVARQADTLLIQLVPLRTNLGEFTDQGDSAAKQHPLEANLKQALAIADQWIQADTLNDRAHAGRAQTLMALGRLAEADSELARVHTHRDGGEYTLMRAHLDVALRRGRGAEARAWFDSLVKAIPDGPGVTLPRGSIELAFGRTARARQGLSVLGQRTGPEAAAYLRRLPNILLGLPDDSIGAYEAAYVASAADSGCDGECRLRRVSTTLFYALRYPRTTWPTFPDSLEDARLEVSRAMAKHDTAGLRILAVRHDSLARRNARMLWPENGWMSIAADAYLALGDSAAALRATRFFLDSATATSAINSGVGNSMFSTVLWPRMMLLRADLAAAAGQREEARFWYERVLDLWATADPELQPTIARIRRAVAALGGARG